MKDVLLGEVWIASGQSNMTHALSGLKDFAKVNLKPGESKRVSVSLDRRSFLFFDVKTANWSAEPGGFRFLPAARPRESNCKGHSRSPNGTNASALLDYGPALLMAQGIHGINLACTARRHKTC